MVKLQKSKAGTFILTVPQVMVMRKGWKGGELFDCQFGSEGQIEFVEVKEKKASG